MLRGVLRVIVFAIAIVAVSSLSASKTDDEFAKRFESDIKPILNEYCIGCHGEEKQKGDVSFSRFEEANDVLGDPDLWYTVLEVIRAHEMPPEDEPRPKYDERKQLEKWLEEMPEEELDCTQLASDRTEDFYEGYVMSRRLTKHEYNNTIRDLFGWDFGVGNLLPADGAGGEGFDNNGSTLYSSSLAIEKYLEAADIVLEAVLPGDGRWMSTEALDARRALVELPSGLSNDREGARVIVRRFARKAFRRSVKEKEVERLLTMYDRAKNRGDDFYSSVRLALKAVLVSPHFLFLSEPEPEERGIQPLGPFTLASRLSYFIWASTPDDELLKLAETGELLDESVYREQIYRMLLDAKSKSMGERFAMQWLGLDRFGLENGPDRNRFPEFDQDLVESMREEVVSYFNFVVSENRSLVELINSDYSFVDSRLAKLYEIEVEPDSIHHRFHFENGNRGGILGMAGIHAANSYPLRTSPVLRGKWILEVLLGGTVNPPPPDVPALEEKGEEITTVSLREELEAHRRDSACAVCHNRMDPLGFSLENFDSLGRWRSHEGERAIDASGKLPSGESFEGPEGLKGVLLNQQDRVIRHFTRKMIGYALGRELNKFDDCVVNDAIAALESDNFRSWNLLERIAISLPFRHRYYAPSNPIENEE